MDFQLRCSLLFTIHLGLAWTVGRLSSSYTSYPLDYYGLLVELFY